MFSLTQLRVFEGDGNQYSNLSELARYKNILYLNAGSNLFRADRLQSVSLRDCQIKDPEMIQNFVRFLPYLRNIDFSLNPIAKDRKVREHVIATASEYLGRSMMKVTCRNVQSGESHIQRKDIHSKLDDDQEEKKESKESKEEKD